MLLQVNGTAVRSALSQADPLSLLNLLLILATLLVSYYAYRTQHLKTDILDVSHSGGKMEFLVKNMSHTSHVVLRMKLRAFLPGDSEPRDLREFSLETDATDLDYLYPERSGTSKRPGLPYRVELGPLDFTRFRTVHPAFEVRPSTTPENVEWHQSGQFEVHLPTSTEDLEDIKEFRPRYKEEMDRELERVEEDLDINVGQLRQFPPYLIPDDVEKLVLEVHQTGEEYVLGKRNGEWHIASKRRREVEIDGAEYKLNKKFSPLNLLYRVKYDLRWYLIDP